MLLFELFHWLCYLIDTKIVSLHKLSTWLQKTATTDAELCFPLQIMIPEFIFWLSGHIGPIMAPIYNGVVGTCTNLGLPTYMIIPGTIIWLSANAGNFLVEHCCSSITISATDDAHIPLMAFLEAEDKFSSCRSLAAETVSKAALPSHSISVTKPWNVFQGWKFVPDIRPQYFYHKNVRFKLRTCCDSRIDSNNNGFPVLARIEQTQLVIFGSSLEPVKRLLLEARKWSENMQESVITIRKPALQKYQRSQNDSNAWITSTGGSCRNLDHVILDKAVKDALLEDFDDFWKPSTRSWYDDHSLPYRRGYLLHGPAGTGKTSVISGIASKLKAPLHMVRLSDPLLTDNELDNMFAQLPPKSIIVLEDIDSVAVDLTLQSTGDFLQNKREGVTLGGLLNILDGEFERRATCAAAKLPLGIASSTGRMVVITTNHPNKVDPSLLRPGRIDRIFELTNATKAQLEGLFVHIHGPHVQSYAKEFAEIVPANEFSPAAILGFLIERRHAALDEVVKQVASWVIQNGEPQSSQTGGKREGL